MFYSIEGSEPSPCFRGAGASAREERKQSKKPMWGKIDFVKTKTQGVGSEGAVLCITITIRLPRQELEMGRKEGEGCWGWLEEQHGRQKESRSKQLEGHCTWQCTGGVQPGQQVGDERSESRCFRQDGKRMNQSCWFNLGWFVSRPQPGHSSNLLSRNIF